VLARALRFEAEAQSARIASLPLTERLVHVAVLSGLGLFVELLLIRWLDAQVLALAYAKNLTLIGCFLGLGIGFALARRPHSLLPLAVPALVLVLDLGVVASQLTLSGPPRIEANVPVPEATSAGEVVAFYSLIALIFVLVVVATIPLGQVAGAFMENIPALRAYAANLVGALSGIALVFALSAWWLPPSVGAALSLGIVVLYLRSARARLVAAVLAVVCVGSMVWLDRQDGILWSPYNKIAIGALPPLSTPEGPRSTGYVLRVQNIYYQKMLDLRRMPDAETLRSAPVYLRQAYYAYNLPYSFKKPGRVLIVGAGTGNDVAAALRHGAREVRAVEIDPAILAYGRRLHPERPYQDPRVRTVVADARSILGRGDDRYDMIVFGLLDAHTSIFSSFANNIRLDNYVYTVEGLRSALAHLTPDGLLSLAFYVDRPWVGSRVGAMLREAAGVPPLVVKSHYDVGFVYLAGPGLSRVSQRPGLAVPYPEHEAMSVAPGPLATDDWPFLYLRKRSVSGPLFWSLGVFVSALVLVRIFFRGSVAFDRHMFFLGAGFLLVETRTIAQLALLFGTTWQVNGITIGAILLLAVLATLLIARAGPMPRAPLYAALALALIANYVVPAGAVVGSGVLVAWAMAAFLGLPVFFSGLIFASSVHGRGDLTPLLASNLVGGVLGGLLENASLVLGVSALSLLALALYGASFRRS
jgi:SAM-dependent methyltransferase